MKKLASILLFIIIINITYALSDQDLKELEDANQLFYNNKYEESLAIYTKVLNKINESIKPEPADLKTKEIVTFAIESIGLILKTREILNKTREALTLEEKNIKSAIDLYIETMIISKRNNIDKVPYSKYIVNSTLEEVLKQKLRQKMDLLAPQFLDKIEKDKKRKKKLGFYSFTKDPTIDFDFQTIIIDNLLNLLEPKKIINIQQRVMEGKWENVIEEAKEKNIDFIITGSYKKEVGEIISFNLVIIDPLINKTLIEAKIIMPLTKEFFYSLDRIIAIIEKNLLNYSRLEEFNTIMLTKKGDERLKQEIKEDKEEGSIVENIKEKVLVLANKYITDLESNVDKKRIKEIKNEKILKTYNNIGEFIDQYNKKEETKKIENILLKDDKKDIIKESVRKEIKDYLEDIKEAKEKQDYMSYYNKYSDLKNEINDFKKEYKYIASIIEEIEKDLDKEKIEIDKIAEKMERVIDKRLGLILDFGFFTLKEKEQEYSALEIDKHNFLGLGIIYEKMITDFFWLNTGLSANVNNIKAKDMKDFIQQLTINAKFGIDIYPVKDFFISNTISFIFPFLDNKEIKIDTPVILSKIGVGFRINNIGLQVNVGYAGSPIKYYRESIGESIEYSSDMNINSIDLELKYYITSGETIRPKTSSKNLWLTTGLNILNVRPEITYSGHEIGKLDFTGIGGGLIYEIDKIDLGFYIIASSSNRTDTWTEYATTHTLKTSFTEAKLLAFIDLKVFKISPLYITLGSSLKVSYLIKRSIIDFSSSGNTDLSDKIGRSHIYITPLNLGFIFDITDDFRIRVNIGKPYEIITNKLEENVNASLKFEFKM